MTKDTLFAWYNDLPPWARGVVVVGGIGIVTYTTYSIVKSINNKKKQQQAQADMQVNSSKAQDQDSINQKQSQYRADEQLQVVGAKSQAKKDEKSFESSLP